MAHRILSTLPKSVKIAGQSGASTHGPVKDPMDFLVVCLLGDGFRWPNIGFYSSRDEDPLGGIDFELTSALPASVRAGGWYWPGKSERDRDGYDHRDPRYDNARDAIVASLKQHPEHATIWAKARGPFAESHHASMRVRAFFSNEDHVKPGTVEAWWNGWICGLHTHTATYLWRGSDDSMIGGTIPRGEKL